jgi:hypothetical protein
MRQFALKVTKTIVCHVHADSYEQALREVRDEDADGSLAYTFDKAFIVIADLNPATVTGGMKSISDDDMCSECRNCIYNPGGLSQCSKDWPGSQDEDGYVQTCPSFHSITISE